MAGSRIDDLRAYERGLKGYSDLLTAVWNRSSDWLFTADERSRVDALRADLSKQYGALRPVLAEPRGTIRTVEGLGEVFDVALMEPSSSPVVAQALDAAIHDVAFAIGHAERVERERASLASDRRETPTSKGDGEEERPPRRGGVAWRNAAATACVGLSGLLLAYAFQPFMFPPSDAVRPYLFGASAVLIVIGSVLLITRESGGHDERREARQEREQEVRIEGGAGGAAVQQSAITGSGNTVTQAARDAIGTQIVIGRRDDEFKGAPHLNWDTQIYKPKGKDFELQVLCTLNGQDARVDPVSWVRSSDPADRIEFVEFDTSGLIRVNPGTFWVRIWLLDPIPGERVISWCVVYHDTHMERGYVTECSIPVSIRLGQMKWDEAAGKKALDLTSPRTRHERYVREYGARPHSLST